MVGSSSPSPLPRQPGGCGMAGKGQPPPAVRPSLPTPQQPGVRRGGRSAAAPPFPPISQAREQHTSPPATVLHNMFSTCVARGIAAKLVYKTVGGKVETSLYCSTAASTPAAAAAAAAARRSQKKGRKRPDNERRKMRREAWLQRRTVSRPDLVSTAVTAAAAATAAATSAATTAATALEESLSSGVCTSAVAATSGQEAGQAGGPAAPGTALTVPVMTAATPPRAWAWEKRDGLVVIARRLQMKPQESPEMARGPEDGCELNLSISSWSEDRELDDKCSGLGSPLTYAEAAAKVPTAQAAAAPGPAAPGETASRAEEGTEPVYRPPPTPPPWSKHFSCHFRRVLCTVCFAGNRKNLEC